MLNSYPQSLSVGRAMPDKHATLTLELKATRSLLEEHKAQLLNYLKATPYEVGLLLNFGPQPQVSRKVYDNELKPNLQHLNRTQI
jgi:GxxExxY protein